MIGFQAKRTFLLGVKSLWLHRLRSTLTVLGMILGVCSVIAMLAIGEGASHDAQEQMRQLGSTNIIIRSVKPPEDKTARQETSQVAQYGLTYDDVERITQTIPSVTVTVPARRVRKDVRNLSRTTDTFIVGTVPWFPRVMNRRVGEGRFLTGLDVRYKENVCVLEPHVALALFPFKDALGQAVKIGSDFYRVVGVMEALSTGKGGTSSARLDSDAGVYVPLSTFTAYLGEVLTTRSAGSYVRERIEINDAIVAVPAVEQVLDTATAVRATLERFHRKLDYEVIVPLEQLRAAEKVKRTYNIVLGSIAAISLLVGGVGIMNIMLASVTERTREIGIRRALGAKRRHIITQFLTETVLLSGFGGVVGVLIGVTIPWFVGRFAGMTTIVTLWSPLVAFSISVMVGVIFGIYPAQRAASMDPIEALRHE